MVPSPKPSTKLAKAKSHLEAKFQEKAHTRVKVLEITWLLQGFKFVGKGWMFYQGVNDSFDVVQNKHKVLYILMVMKKILNLRMEKI